MGIGTCLAFSGEQGCKFLQFFFQAVAKFITNRYDTFIQKAKL